jgi:hypothetical protein
MTLAQCPVDKNRSPISHFTQVGIVSAVHFHGPTRSPRNKWVLKKRLFQQYFMDPPEAQVIMSFEKGLIQQYMSMDPPEAQVIMSFEKV